MSKVLISVMFDAVVSGGASVTDGSWSSVPVEHKNKASNMCSLRLFNRCR